MPDERLSRLEELMAEMLIKHDRMDATMQQMQANMERMQVNMERMQTTMEQTQAVMLSSLNAQQQMLDEIRATREDQVRYEERTEQRFHRVEEELRTLNDRVTDIQGYVQRIHHHTVNSNEDLRQRVGRLESRMDDIERKAS